MSNRLAVFNINAGHLELFVSDCPNCGVVFAIPTTLEDRRREDHRTFYCPNGHSMSFQGPTEAEKRAKQEKQRADHLAASLMAQQDQTQAAFREAAEAKASEVRLRWRVGNGVCPCCNRTFAALAAHVVTKHPEFVHQDIETLSTRMRELLVTIRQATEAEDSAVVDAYDIGVSMQTVKALARRGLVDRIDYSRVALTEAGWPIAEQIAAQS